VVLAVKRLEDSAPSATLTALPGVPSGIFASSTPMFGVCAYKISAFESGHNRMKSYMVSTRGVPRLERRFHRVGGLISKQSLVVE